MHCNVATSVGSVASDRAVRMVGCMVLVRQTEDGVDRGDLASRARAGDASDPWSHGADQALEALQALGYIRAKLESVPRWSAEAERLDDERVRLERRLALRTGHSAGGDG